MNPQAIADLARNSAEAIGYIIPVAGVIVIIVGAVIMRRAEIKSRG